MTRMAGGGVLKKGYLAKKNRRGRRETEGRSWRRREPLLGLASCLEKPCEQA
jgi:hypothetical protein